MQRVVMLKGSRDDALVHTYRNTYIHTSIMRLSKSVQIEVRIYM